MHFLVAKGDFIDFLDNEVSQNSSGLAVLSADCELTATCVLMHGNERPPVRLSHHVELLLDDVNLSGLNGVWVPQVDCIDYELRVDVLEQKVTLVVLAHVAFHVSCFLQEQVAVSVGRSSLCSVDLWLAH